MHNKKLIIAATLAMLGHSAVAAGDFDPVHDFPLHSPAAAGLTRAEVVRQVLEARADGTLNQDVDANLFRSFPARSLVTRAQVRAEFERARHDGSLLPFDTGSRYAEVAPGPGASREAVRAETLQALQALRSQRRYGEGR